MNTSQRFNAGDTGAVVCVVDARGLVVGSFTVDSGASAWSLLAMEVVYRSGGGPWTVHPDSSAINSTTRSSGRLDITWADQVALRVTTPEASSKIYNASFYGLDS